MGDAYHKNRTKEQRETDAQRARDQDKARTEALGGERIRSRAAEQRRIEREAIKEAARREKGRVDAEKHAARVDKHSQPPKGIGRDGVKVTGDHIFEGNGDDGPPPSTRFFDYWDNGVLRQIAVHVD